ncbi:MAG: 4Fe-4S binding protein [Candidatus Thermoplasmatota archaeon]
MLFEKTNLTILPKDDIVEIKLNKTIQPMDSIAVPSKIVEHFIKKSGYRFIMNFCICREAMDCQNYPKELGCLFMGEAAKNINKNFGKEATKKEAIQHVKKCREIGLIHLIGRDMIDEKWLGTTPGTRLLVVCNCCYCCCLWRMLPDINKKMASSIKKMPGIKIEITEECNGCGECQKVCFVKAIKIEDGKAKINEECRGCGRCADKCPNDAIKVIIEDKDFVEKTIKRINSSVDVT